MLKRTQVERMAIAETIISVLWDEVRQGNVESISDLLQSAVYVQTDINRIVWKLNEINNHEDGERRE